MIINKLHLKIINDKVGTNLFKKNGQFAYLQTEFICDRSTQFQTKVMVQYSRYIKDHYKINKIMDLWGGFKQSGYCMLFSHPSTV